mgnify:CR=1 FL=1
MYRTFFYLFLFLIVFKSGLCLGQSFVYSDKEGDKKIMLRVSKKHDQGKQMLKLESKEKVSKHVFDPGYFTLEWEIVDHVNQHDFQVRRQENSILIKGLYKGKPLNRTVEIDDKPWINKLDHGLTEWVNSNDEELVFWTLKLNSGLDPIKFDAQKVGRERLQTSAGSFDTIKVRLSLHGFLLTKLWSAYCWYRLSDGLFIKYEGDTGPGTQLRTIELEKIL